MESKVLMRRLQESADRASQRKSDATRHKCFVSYHVADIEEVEQFVEAFGDQFIPMCLGVTEDAEFVDSTDEEYIKSRIRELYLTNSTVTIVLLGKCTWARRFVDWEIASSLRDDPVNKRSGLLVIPLPSMNNRAKLPERVKDNWAETDPDASYAFYVAYPKSSGSLRAWIDKAFAARTSKADKVDNSRSLRRRNADCG